MGDEGCFDDYEGDGPDDSAALDEWAHELTVAVSVFEVPIFERGTPER